MSNGKITLYSIIGLVVLIAVIFVLGYTGVFFTKTVGKAQQNANREVFEQTQSYVEGKRQEAVKYYKEWLQAKDVESKKTIESLVSHSFANFDETKLDGQLQTFVYNCKYKP
jgi:flagellin-like protein